MSKVKKEVPPKCDDCGMDMEYIGHGIGWECMDDKSPCRKITEHERMTKFLSQFKPVPKEKYTYQEILDRADDAVRLLRMKAHPYTAPELIPGIGSNQIKALIQILVDVLNGDIKPKVHAKKSKSRSNTNKKDPK